MSLKTKFMLITLCLLSALNAVALVFNVSQPRLGGRSWNELPGPAAGSRFHACGQDHRRAMQRERRHREAEVPGGMIWHRLSASAAAIVPKSP